MTGQTALVRNGKEHDGHRPWAVASDVVRVLALLSAAVVAPSQPFEAVLRFLLIFGVLLGTRVAAVPRPFDTAFGVLLLVSAWSSALGWYFEHPWIDVPIHFALPGATAAIAYVVAARADVVPALPDADLRARGAVALATLMLGVNVAVVWELYEWLAATYLPSRILVGYDDTIGDLAMGLLGSVVAGVILAWWETNGRPLRASRRNAM